MPGQKPLPDFLMKPKPSQWPTLDQKPTLDYRGAEPPGPPKARALPKPKPLFRAYVEIICILLLLAFLIFMFAAFSSAM